MIQLRWQPGSERYPNDVDLMVGVDLKAWVTPVGDEWRVRFALELEGPLFTNKEEAMRYAETVVRLAL